MYSFGCVLVNVNTFGNTRRKLLMSAKQFYLLVMWVALSIKGAWSNGCLIKQMSPINFRKLTNQDL